MEAGSIAGGRWRGYTSRQPQWWLLAAAAAAWIGLLSVLTLGGQTDTTHHEGVTWIGLGGWATMVVAMLLPFASKEARWLAFRSLRRRRQHAIAAFAAGFLLPWLAVGTAAVAVTSPLHGDLLAAAVALALAAVWQVMPVRRRVLRRCGALRAPATRRGRHAADCMRSGAVAGGRCVLTCWAVMLPMAMVHHPGLMAGAMLVMASERRNGPNPEQRAGRSLEALWLAAAAVIAALLGAGAAG
jgi:Predicted metal-binding integral membrane protein (DUF2182)